MRFAVDLQKCQDHAQCVFAAPQIFSLDERGKLALKNLADEEYVSGEIAEDAIDDVETAVDICPLQAIYILD